MRRIFETFKDDPTIQFCLRTHPNLKGFDNSQTREIKQLAALYPNVLVISAEDTVDSYGLLAACDVALTFGSTIGVEACYWGKPSILAGRALYQFLDCCYKPNNHEELVAMIKSDLKPKPREESLKYGYWEARRGIPFEYFKQTSMYGGGIFLGHSTALSKSNSFVLKLLRLLQTKTYARFLRKLYRSA